MIKCATEKPFKRSNCEYAAEDKKAILLLTLFSNIYGSLFLIRISRMITIDAISLGN
jgi:hypothetical protein